MLKKFRFKSITIVVSVLLFFFSCQNVIAHGFRLQNSNEIQQQTATSDQLLAQQDFDQVEVQTIPVRDNIYMLATENSGNIGITAGDDGVLMIDSQFIDVEVGGSILNNHNECLFSKTFLRTKNIN